ARHVVLQREWPGAAYDVTRTVRRHHEREQWGRDVVLGYHGLAWLAAGRDYDRQPNALTGSTIEIHAGVHYVTPIRSLLAIKGATVELPLEGLGIGEQLAWYKQRLDPQMRIGEPA